MGQSSVYNANVCKPQPIGGLAMNNYIMVGCDVYDENIVAKEAHNREKTV